MSRKCSRIRTGPLTPMKEKKPKGLQASPRQALQMQLQARRNENKYKDTVSLMELMKKYPKLHVSEIAEMLKWTPSKVTRVINLINEDAKRKQKEKEALSRKKAN